MDGGRRLTSREAARALGVSKASVKRWADSGLLPTEKTAGGHRRFRPDDLAAARRASPTAAEAPIRGRVGTLAVFAVLWVGGVASQWLGVGRDDTGALASPFLLTAGLVVVLGEGTRRGALVLACVALLGFAAEASGVSFGIPFGRYSYTDALRPQLLGVPVVMGPAWAVLVAFASDAAGRLRLGGWKAAVFAALLTTATDLVIDPLAANRLGYSRWEEAGSYYGVPLVNFAGWFLTALVACRVTGARANLWAGFVGAAILLFFSMLALAHSLPYVALVGFALCLARFLMTRLSPRR